MPDGRSAALGATPEWHHGLLARGPSETSFNVGAVVTLKGSQTGVEQLALRHDNDVKTWRDLMTTKNLAYEALGSIAFNRSPEPLRGGDAQASNRKRGGQDKQRCETTVNFGAAVVHLLKLGAPANVFLRPEAGHKSYQLSAISFQLGSQLSALADS